MPLLLHNVSIPSPPNIDQSAETPYREVTCKIVLLPPNVNISNVKHFHDRTTNAPHFWDQTPPLISGRPRIIAAPPKGLNAGNRLKRFVYPLRTVAVLLWASREESRLFPESCLLCWNKIRTSHIQEFVSGHYWQSHCISVGVRCTVGC